MVEQRADGQIGPYRQTRQPADGARKISVGNHPLAPALFKQLPYDIMRDFAPISHAATSGYVLVVNPDVVKSVPDWWLWRSRNPES
jgi:tripartite-type tricarboxylate transporter receptor subunit TctC